MELYPVGQWVLGGNVLDIEFRPFFGFMFYIRQGCRQPLGAEKGEEVHFPLELPEGMQPANALSLAHWEPFWVSDFHKFMMS